VSVSRRKKPAPKNVSEGASHQSDQKFKPYWHGQHAKLSHQPSTHSEESDTQSQASHQNKYGHGKSTGGSSGHKSNKGKDRDPKGKGKTVMGSQHTMTPIL